MSQDVLVYNTRNAAIDESELELTELPEIPDWFQEALLESGGTCDGYANVRVVSGLDPNITEFYGGEWHRKYAFFEHDNVSYHILHKPDGTKKILSPAEASILDKSPHKQGIITVVKEHRRREYGIPRYFVEYYRPSVVYGIPEIWEEKRWIEEEDGKRIDLMGEFPHEGKYETWFCIEEPVVRFGEVVSTKFRQLDDVVLELIKHKIEESKKASLAAQHNESVKERLNSMQKQFDATREEIRDRVSDRVDRIMQG